MAVRWFQAFHTYGRAPQVIEEVARFIRNENLADTVVSLRVERAAGREFLLFLTLQTEQWGVTPDEVQATLSGCRHLRFPVQEAFTLDQIAGMVSGDLQLTSLGQSLEYHRVIREAYEDPFETEARVLLLDADLPQGVGERLLWFLSATGSGPWTAFRAACAALHLNDGAQAARLSRHLRLLGHLEVLPGGRWVVPPTAVVEIKLAGTEPQRFLTGARDSRLAAGDLAEPQPGGPDIRFVITTGERLLLHAPGEHLAAVLPDIRGLTDSLELLQSVNAHALKLKRFGGQHFELCDTADRTGLYALTLPDDRTIHALKDGDCWRRGEFFTLRFLALAQLGVLGPWQYAAAPAELAVRHEQRPPEIYERCLVLCSGRLPEHRGGWLVYQNVPADLVSRLTSLLGMAVVTA